MSTTLTVRGPAQAVAAVDHVLGFTPTESLVMLTQGAKNAFHARLDLPPLRHSGDVAACVETMLAPALQHEVKSVLLITYSARPAAQLSGLAMQLHDAFSDAGIRIHELMHVSGGMIESHFPQPGDSPIPVNTHEADVIRTRMIAEGRRAPLASRDDLAQWLHGADTTPVANQITLCQRLTDTDSSREPEIVLELVVDAMNGARALSDVDVARIALSTADGAVRDALLGFICRPNAEAFVDVFTDLVRRVPTEHREWPATMLAFGAWQAGHGALAWIALNEAEIANTLASETGGTRPNSLAQMVTIVLDKALPPSIWEDLRTTTTS